MKALTAVECQIVSIAGIRFIGQVHPGSGIMPAKTSFSGGWEFRLACLIQGSNFSLPVSGHIISEKIDTAAQFPGTFLPGQGHIGCSAQGMFVTRVAETLQGREAAHEIGLQQ